MSIEGGTTRSRDILKKEDSGQIEYRTYYGISPDPCSAGGEIPTSAARERRCWAVAVPVSLPPSIFFPAGPRR